MKMNANEVIDALIEAVSHYVDEPFPILDEEGCERDDEVMAFVRIASPHVLSAAARLLQNYRSVMWDVQDELENGGEARECDQVLGKQMRDVLRFGETK